VWDSWLRYPEHLNFRPPPNSSPTHAQCRGLKLRSWGYYQQSHACANVLHRPYDRRLFQLRSISSKVDWLSTSLDFERSWFLSTWLTTYVFVQIFHREDKFREGWVGNCQSSHGSCLSLKMNNWLFTWVKLNFGILELSAIKRYQDITLTWKLFLFRCCIYSLWFEWGGEQSRELIM
jgi:hypothetical protein